jgi:hypothetical protein
MAIDVAADSSGPKCQRRMLFSARQRACNTVQSISSTRLLPSNHT